MFKLYFFLIHLFQVFETILHDRLLSQSSFPSFLNPGTAGIYLNLKHYQSCTFSVHSQLQRANYNSRSFSSGKGQCMASPSATFGNTEPPTLRFRDHLTFTLAFVNTLMATTVMSITLSGTKSYKILSHKEPNCLENGTNVSQNSRY